LLPNGEKQYLPADAFDLHLFEDAKTALAKLNNPYPVAHRAGSFAIVRCENIVEFQSAGEKAKEKLPYLWFLNFSDTV
ncbi:hypothetical protein ACC695_40635, partial [Rhizobium ruizarguesonis]